MKNGLYNVPARNRPGHSVLVEVTDSSSKHVEYRYWSGAKRQIITSIVPMEKFQGIYSGISDRPLEHFLRG